MSSDKNENRGHYLAIKLWVAAIALILLLASADMPASAQGGFNSGSTGADGAFNPATTQSVQMPASGVFNYTTVNIPNGVTITFIPNANNTPLVILTQGDLTIGGSINMSGANGANLVAGGVGGPGGGRGGNGGLTLAGSTDGQPGDGPGGGLGGSGTTGFGGGGGFTAAGASSGGAPNGQGGQAYGGVSLLPLLGGSGGGGSSSTGVGGSGGAGGGGAGGAILIACSGNIILSGAIPINANGGSGGVGGGSGPRGGGGSGGAIRLIANTISGSGFLRVLGGNFGGTATRAGASGFVRIEAFNYGGLSPSLDPGTVISFAAPGSVAPPATTPSLRVSSVAGIAAPASPRGSFNAQPDILIPSTQANPVTVAIEASNLPLGTVVDVTVTPERAAPTTVQSTPLSGTEANSTATASVTLSNVISVISARVVIDFNPLKPGGKAANQMPIFIDGERVRQMEVAATYGGASEITYVTVSGRRVKKPNQ